MVTAEEASRILSDAFDGATTVPYANASPIATPIATPTGPCEELTRLRQASSPRFVPPSSPSCGPETRSRLDALRYLGREVAATWLLAGVWIVVVSVIAALAVVAAGTR